LRLLERHVYIFFFLLFYSDLLITTHKRCKRDFFPLITLSDTNTHTLTHTHSLSLSLSHTHTHTQTHTHTHVAGLLGIEPSQRHLTIQHVPFTTDSRPCPDGIRTCNYSKRAAADPRLRPRSHGDHRVRILTVENFTFDPV
jgi:hypothetical protein